jgi:MFS family permease
MTCGSGFNGGACAPRRSLIAFGGEALAPARAAKPSLRSGGRVRRTLRRTEGASPRPQGASPPTLPLSEAKGKGRLQAAIYFSLLPIPNPYRGLRGLPADVWMIAATNLVNRAGMMALPFLVLYLTKALAIPAALAGLGIGVYGLGGLIVAPFAGRLADRIGPFTVIRGALAGSGVMLLLIPLARNLPAVIALVFVWALIAEAARPAGMAALTSAVLPEQRRAAVALNRLAVNLGMSIGPAVGGFLALISFRLIFIVDGLTSLAAAALLTTLLWLRHRRGLTTAEHAAVAARRERSFGGSAVVWRDPAALLFFVICFLFNFVFAQHQGAMPVFFVRDLHYKESFYGSLFVLNTLLIVAIEVPLNLAMSRWPARRALWISIMLIAVGFGALAFTRSAFAIAGATIVWTFGEMICFPTATSYVAELAPAGRAGEYMGAFSATFSLALIVAPAIGGALLDRFGGTVTWLTMFGIGAASAALMALASTSRRACPDAKRRAVTDPVPGS